jgi:hypothetical protein
MGTVHAKLPNVVLMLVVHLICHSFVKLMGHVKLMSQHVLHYPVTLAHQLSLLMKKGMK